MSRYENQKYQLAEIYQSSLSEDFKNEQNRLKKTKEILINQCEEIEKRISQELDKLKETSKLINQAAHSQTKVYHESLNSDHYSKDLIHFNTLSSYLKNEKAYLSDIVASESSTPKSNKQLLHSLSNKRKMEKHLQQLESFKLEKEIEYLEKYILVGNAKDGRQRIVYEDVESVTIKEEKEQIERLSQSIEELERLVTLSNECGGNVNNEVSEKISLLNTQTERLEMVENMLERETKQIVQVKDFFKDYEPKEIIQLLSENIYRFEQNCYHKENQNHQNQPSNLTKEELEFVLNYTLRAPTMQIFKQPYQEVNDLIKTCKTKLKKIKS